MSEQQDRAAEAEAIVQLLAAAAAPLDSDTTYCLLCEAEGDLLRLADPERPYGRGNLYVDNPEAHQETCPWRLAREWIRE